MNRASDLRRTADRYRRLASIPTSGGHSADRELLVLAQELDHHAAELAHRIHDGGGLGVAEVA
jgi:hypothetical protein